MNTTDTVRPSALEAARLAHNAAHTAFKAHVFRARCCARTICATALELRARADDLGLRWRFEEDRATGGRR